MDTEHEDYSTLLTTLPTPQKRERPSPLVTQDENRINELVIQDTTSVCSEQILESVMNELFDNVLVHLNESLSGDVMKELLMSTSMNGKHRPVYNMECSTEKIMDAVRRNEMSHQGNSCSVLQRLINLKSAPFVSDTAINYINRSFLGQAYAIEKGIINQNHPCPCVVTISHDRPEAHDKLLSIDETNREHNEVITEPKHLTKIVFTKACLTSLLGSIAITTVAVYGLSLVLRHSDTNQVALPFSAVNDTLVAPQNTALTTPRSRSSSKRRSETICVQTYADYQNAMFKIPFGTKITLTISLQNASDWPINAALGNAHLLTSLKLEGAIDITTILLILKGMVNLEELSISNSSKLLCTMDKIVPVVHIPKIELSRVKAITFENIGECQEFYKMISRHLLMKHLTTFRMESGVIDRHNVKCIQRLIRYSCNTLKSIEFPGTVIHVPFLEPSLGKLVSVHSLSLDFMDTGSHDITYINEHMNYIFPNLRTFLSQSGYVPWAQFLHLSTCSKLHSVTVGLLIAESSFDLNNIRITIPSIAEADLSFYFTSFREGCKLNGVTESLDFFDHLTYNHNCGGQTSSEEI